jgi:hypothetical protein
MILFSLSSCGMEANPVEEWESAKREVIYKAEKETEEAHWSVDIENETLFVKHLGLSPLFLSEEKSDEFHLRESSLFGIAQSLNLGNNSLLAQAFLDEYNRHQHATEVRITELQQHVSDSLKSYKNLLETKLSDGRISKIQYDHLMTSSEGTFKAIIRQELYKAHVVVSSSKNLRRLLDDIQQVLEKKKWDEFLNRLKKRK